MLIEDLPIGEAFTMAIYMIPFVIIIFGLIILGQSLFFHHTSKPGRLLKVYLGCGLIAIGFAILAYQGLIAW